MAGGPFASSPCLSHTSQTLLGFDQLAPRRSSCGWTEALTPVGPWTGWPTSSLCLISLSLNGAAEPLHGVHEKVPQSWTVLIERMGDKTGTPGGGA